MNHLKHNTIGPVYVIRNRENKSDPGTNTSYTEYGNLYIAEDADKYTLQYMKYDNTQYCTKYKLASTFDVSISIYGDLTVSNGTYTTDHTKNTRKTSNTVLTSYTSSSRLNMQDDALMFEIQSAFLQKRCGDWLQVLSCADTSREYLIRGTRQNLNHCIPYYCSSDRPSVAYALYLGINTILKSGSSYQVFRADPRRFSYMSCEQWYNNTYRDYSTDQYVETRTSLQGGLALYERVRPLFLTMLSSINDASNATELKECMKYAIRYRFFLKNFDNHAYKKKYILQFIADPTHPLFSERNGAGKRYIVSTVDQYKDILKRYTDDYIHSDIFDKSYAEFNPLAFQTGLSRSTFKYNTIYGQALLYMLLDNDDEEGSLKQFVQVCIQKISEFAEDETVALHYSYFLARHLSIQMGGGVTYSNDELLHIGTYLLDYLNETTLVGRVFKSYKTLSHHLSTDYMCEELLKYIVLQGLLVDEYAAFTAKTSDTSDTDKDAEANAFLKIDDPIAPRPTHVMQRPIFAGGAVAGACRRRVTRRKKHAVSNRDGRCCCRRRACACTCRRTQNTRKSRRSHSI